MKKINGNAVAAVIKAMQAEYYPDLSASFDGLKALRERTKKALIEFFSDPKRNDKLLWKFMIQPYPMTPKQCYIALNNIENAYYRESHGLESRHKLRKAKKNLKPPRCSALSDACNQLQDILKKVKP